MRPTTGGRKKGHGGGVTRMGKGGAHGSLTPRIFGESCNRYEHLTVADIYHGRVESALIFKGHSIISISFLQSLPCSLPSLK